MAAGNRLFTLALTLAILLAGCAKDPEYVPVTVERAIPPAPGECSRAVPSDLPAVPPIEGKSADPARVNAHWARANIESRRFYRSVRDGYRVCQKYALGVARK